MLHTDTLILLIPRYYYRNPALCRVFFIGHSAKKSLPSAALDNDRVYWEQDFRHRNTLGTEIFAEC
jgi:hypothetical protein